MKERPILFSGEMVRAILEGRKTQTRRVMKPQPTLGDKPGYYCDPYNKNYGHFTFWTSDNKMCNGQTGNIKNTCHWKPPYGLPGDRLWVREAFSEDHPHGIIFYKADYPQMVDDDGEKVLIKPEDFKWRPSIHMPRYASRILLEIVSVRVERLQDMSPADAQADGGFTVQVCQAKRYPAELIGKFLIDSFAALWEKINGKDSWDKNPWVWVIEFKRVQS